MSERLLSATLSNRETEIRAKVVQSNTKRLRKSQLDSEISGKDQRIREAERGVEKKKDKACSGRLRREGTSR